MIGEKIRTIRKNKNLTIVEFSEKINVTSGYVSQIERDLISPSLTVLKRMSKVLEVPLSILFMDEKSDRVVVVSKNERTKVKFGNINVELEFLTPVLKCYDKSLNGESFLFKIPPKSWASNDLISFDTKELLFVLKGRMEFHMGEKIYSISEGDSISISENSEHLVYNPDEVESEAICTLIPPVHNRN